MLTRDNFLRILLVFLLVAASVFVFFYPKTTETNILKAILSNSEQDYVIVDLSKKQSAKINVVFESQDPDELSAVSESFFNNFDKTIFYTKDVNVDDVLAAYKKYHNNLLSDKTAVLLKNGDYDKVVQEATERLYNPTGIALLPLQEDPFLLLGDFIGGLGSGRNDGIQEIDGKYYETAEFYVKKDIALSPSLLNSEIKKLVNLQKSMSDENTRIYLSGAPVHTYFASSKSMRDINLICLLSSIFVILICKFYFKSFKILLPVALSLAVGMYAGYLAACMFFDSIHILTFVFASTLIGICVDYSLHYFAHNKNLNLILNSLTQSLLTTVCAFLVLLLSNIELLRQISVFTSTGLVAVYLFVVLYYPVICKNIDINAAAKPLPLPHAGKKFKAAVYGAILAVIVLGLFHIKFNDDIKDMYVPPKALLSAENLYAKVSERSFNYSFVTVKAENTQKLLEKEEAVADMLKKNGYEYYALSRFVPSVKKQKENISLRQNLYKKSLMSYAEFLTPAEVKKLLDFRDNHDFLTLENLNIFGLQDFQTSSQSSVMVVQNDMSKDSIKSVQNIDGTWVVNLKRDISQKVKNCRQVCLILFVPALAVLFLILALIYKPVNALKITAPSFIGAVFAIALARIVFGSVNLFHVLAMFLIIGFSIDYSIFRFNGARGKNDSNSEASRNAVLISCATSAFSFFLLSVTGFKLISSLGFVLCAGILSSYILSVLIISESTHEHTDNI